MSAPEYQPFSKLRKVWSPADMQKLREDVAKFEALPAMPTPAGVFMPQFDGDLAQLDELDELADRVFDQIDAGTGVAACFDEDDIYEQMRWWFNLSSWPIDRAVQQLAEWPQRIIEPVIA